MGFDELQDLIKQGREAATKGDFLQAHRLYQEGHDGLEALMGPTHMSTLKALLTYAKFCNAQDQVGEVEDRFLKSMHIHQSILGSEDPQTIQLLISLASYYYEQNRHGEAEKLLVQAKQSLQVVYVDDQETLFLKMLRVVKYLVKIFKGQSDLERAEQELLGQIAKASALGSAYLLQCLDLKHELSHLYQDKDWEATWSVSDDDNRAYAAMPVLKVERLLIEIIEMVEAQLAPQKYRPGLLVCSYRRLLDIYDRGDRQKLESLLDRLVATLSRFKLSVIRSHPGNLLDIKRLLARYFFKLEKYAEAQLWFSEAQQEMDVVFGPYDRGPNDRRPFNEIMYQGLLVCHREFG